MTTHRADTIFLIGVLMLALLLRIVPLTYSHFWDETVYLQHAMILVDGRANYDELGYRPPVLPFLYAAGFLVWNDIYVANVVQGLFTTLAVLFGFLYARHAFGRGSAWCVALLLAFTPYLVVASHELLTDAPALTLMLASMWAFEKPGTRFIVLSGVLYSLAVQTRFTSIFLVLYFLLQAVVVHRKPGELGWWLLSAAAAVGPYLAWSRWNYGSFFHPFIVGRRMVTEWSAAAPASFYWDALGVVFPISIWMLAVVGFLAPLVRGFAMRGTIGMRQVVLTDACRRNIVLLMWGVAFLGYMLTIPHKETRYLLPLVIPVATLGGGGLGEVVAWIARRSPFVRMGGVLLLGVVAVVQYGSPFQKLAEPWVDRSEWEAVQIGNYLKRISTTEDVIYAVHEFPVFAFYSGRKTVSLLPIQANFEQAWRRVMKEPGYFVAYDPAFIQTHSPQHAIKPDRDFLDSRPEFHAVRSFPNVTVYRYAPLP